jgi:hypothetical protein
MALGAFAYNFLRYIGQTGLIAPLGPMRHSAKRRGLRTVIQELMYLAGRQLTTGRRLKLRFSRHRPGLQRFQRRVRAAGADQLGNIHKQVKMIRDSLVLGSQICGFFKEQDASLAVAFGL